MSTDTQSTANRANAQSSTGPVTAEGKLRSAQNSTKHGLFSASAFILPGEQQRYAEHCGKWQRELAPSGVIENALADEIIQAAWRLERCKMMETSMHFDDCDECDRTQASVDRARATAQRGLHRGLAEIRRIQTERLYRRIGLPGDFDSRALGQASCKSVNPIAISLKQSASREAAAEAGLKERFTAMRQQSFAAYTQQTQFAERSQSASPAPVLTPRGAQCPCGSGEKYKRCCGKDAPPVLGCAA